VTRVCWLSLRFLALYALLLGIFALPPLQHAAGSILGALAARILQLCSGGEVYWSLTAGGIHFTVLAGEPGEMPVSRWLEMPILEHVRNVPLFVAIVLAAAKVRRKKFLLVLGAGTLGLIIIDSLIAAAEAWEYVSGTVPFNGAYEVLALFRVYHVTGAAGMFAAPVFIGALCALALLRDEGGPAAKSVKRNDPCPCGSGRKWKQCCGA
jgi:hypothetical protein